MINRNNIMDDMFGRPGKKCAMCGRYLEHWQFNTSKTSKDGLQSYCKACQKAYRIKHPDKQYKRNRRDKSLPIW